MPTAQQSIMLTFNPLSLNVQAVLDHIRATKEIKVTNVVEESPYNPAYVKDVLEASQGPHTRIDNIEDVWNV